MQRNAKLLRSLFLLRLGLGVYLLLFSLDKFIAPQGAIQMFSQFNILGLSSSIIMLLGACELALSLFMIFGFHKTFTYGVGLALHVLSMMASYQELLSPFGTHNVFIAKIPILFSFIALFKLRDLDTMWTLGKKKSLFAK